MSFPAHYVGSYTGTGAALSVLDAGFQPSYIRIYNDTDNDVCFDFFSNQSAGLAVKMGSSSFTGSAPYSAQTAAVTHAASPAGNEVYVKLQNDGSPYLCCNMANDTADKVVALSGDGNILIKHDASASSNGVALTYDDGGTPDRLEATFVGEANVNISTETQGWVSQTPAGSIGSPVSEISSQGITLDVRGFTLGTDSVLNESGKVYRYICLR